MLVKSPAFTQEVEKVLLDDLVKIVQTTAEQYFAPNSSISHNIGLIYSKKHNLKFLSASQGKFICMGTTKSK